MNSSRPYLVRALYEWLVDNECTPLLLVDAYGEDVEVPLEYLSDGKIILNIAPAALSDLVIGNDLVSFNARFGGLPVSVRFPPKAILAIYAKENGRGMVFDEMDGSDGPSPSDPTPKGPGSKGKQKPQLRVVK